MEDCSLPSNRKVNVITLFQELTEALYDHFDLGQEGGKILGIDVDQNLIEVAREKIASRSGISFEKCDIVSDGIEGLKEYLLQEKREKFIKAIIIFYVFFHSSGQ